MRTDERGEECKPRGSVQTTGVPNEKVRRTTRVVSPTDIKAFVVRLREMGVEQELRKTLATLYGVTLEDAFGSLRSPNIGRARAHMFAFFQTRFQMSIGEIARLCKRDHSTIGKVLKHAQKSAGV